MLSNQYDEDGEWGCDNPWNFESDRTYDDYEYLENEGEENAV